MKIETVFYWTRKIADIRDQLPDFVKQAMIKLPYNRFEDQRYMIKINAQNREAVAYIDNGLREFIVTGRCMRRYDIEIDKNEIPNYTHFNILPVHLEYHKYVYADVKMPDCRIDGCFVGSKLLLPVKVKRKKTEKLDIATLNYPWEKEVVLLLSARIKKIFESEGITGLVYEPAQFISAAHRIKYVRVEGISKMSYKEIPDDSPTTLENPYIARIPHAIYCEADWIFNEILCQTHSVPRLGMDMASFIGPINSRISKNEIGNVDMFQVQGTQIHGKIYNYVNNQFYISRKALEILLKHDAKGLHRVGSIIKSKFAPLTEISD